MKVGDLVRIRHNERHGYFIVIEHISGDWVGMVSIRTGTKTFELERSLEVMSESR